MSAPLSEQLLDEIREREVETRGGPWVVADALEGDGFPGHLWVVRSPEDVPGDESVVVSVGDRAVAEFIAASRQDVPALLVEVEQLREHFDQAIAGFNAQSLRVTELRQEVVRARVAGLLDAAAIVDNDDDCGCGGCDTCIPRALARQIRDRAYSVAQGGV